MNNPHTEVLPGFTRVDLEWQAECLEGQHGDARIVETAPLAAKFIRAALARPPVLLPVVQPLPRRAQLLAPAHTPDDLVLTQAERAEILKQRERAQRNAGDPEPDA